MAEQHNSLANNWAAPPGAPIRYSFTARIGDIFHGRRDGHKGLPEVTLPLPGEAPLDAPGQNPSRPDDGRPGADGPRRATPLDRYAVPECDGEPIGTPHLLKLRALASDQVDHERLTWLADVAPVRMELADLNAQVTSLTAELETAQARRNDAATKPGEEDLKERRTAELDPQSRPDRLIRDRRLGEHRKRYTDAENTLLALTRQLATAKESVRARDRQLIRRAAVARARARRINEHYWRRIATYWQQLVRVHPQGRQLNACLRLVGPELPDWAVEPDTPEGE